jgi:hypothetical protein
MKPCCSASLTGFLNPVRDNHIIIKSAFNKRSRQNNLKHGTGYIVARVHMRRHTPEARVKTRAYGSGLLKMTYNINVFPLQIASFRY